MAVETWPTYMKTTTNQLPTVNHQASFSFSGFMMLNITAAKAAGTLEIPLFFLSDNNSQLP